MYHHFGITFTEYGFIVELEFQPGRITTDNIKATSQPEYFDELQHRVEEVVAAG